MTHKETTQSGFPSHSASNAEKATKEYGMMVANKIEQQWFSPGGNTQLYYTNRDNFHRKRLYALGKQNVDKYKNEFSSSGDLSYSNLDWTPVPIIPKFVNIITEGMQERDFAVHTTAIDPVSASERKRFIERLRGEMSEQGKIRELQQQTDVGLFENDPNSLPGSEEELQLHIQLNYKQNVELAMETAIEYVSKLNRCDEIKRKVDYDLVTLGIGVQKVNFDKAEGVTVEYVNPDSFVYSQNVNDNNFNDCFYFGEVKRVHISEIQKIYPELSPDDIREIQEKSAVFYKSVGNPYDTNDTMQGEYIELLYFSYKTSHNEIHKIKDTPSGGKKAIERDESFKPPADKRSGFEKSQRVEQVIYDGVKIAGCEYLLQWELAKNMMRPGAHSPKVIMPYCVATTEEYQGQVHSLVDRMITYADMIQMTHLKLQQAIQRLVPPGVYIDIDSLANVDLGNGTSYNPSEALNMYFQTGSIVGRSQSDDGLAQSGPPIQELPGGGGNQVELLIATYNYYLNMIRDVTGVNEARDGSMPDGDVLVGVQKLAAKASNRATKHITAASERILNRSAENISLRISDIIEYSPIKKQFIQAIGSINVEVLEDIKKIHMHEFGIFVELGPDEEQKAMVEQNIATAMSQGLLMIEDAVDIRNIKNPKLANQMIKVRRNLRAQEEQAKQEAVVEKQAMAQADAAAKIEMSKAQAEQIKMTAKIQLESAKAQHEQARLQKEVEAKKQLMTYEWELNMKSKELDVTHAMQLNREKLRSSEKIANAKNADAFESKNNDTIGSGFGLEAFDPR